MGTKTNIEHLKDLISKDSFNKEEALEFIDAVEKDQSDVLDSLKKTEEERLSIESELNNQQENGLQHEIDCGIGKIEWEADNLQLEGVMEDFAKLFKSYTPLEINKWVSQKLHSKEVVY